MRGRRVDGMAAIPWRNNVIGELQELRKLIKAIDYRLSMIELNLEQEKKTPEWRAWFEEGLFTEPLPARSNAESALTHTSFIGGRIQVRYYTEWEDAPDE